MVKRVITTATFVVLTAACAGAVTVLFYEDFEEEQFPPDRWSTRNFTPGSGVWERRAEGENHYARGKSQDYKKTWLISPTFKVAEDELISWSLKYREGGQASRFYYFVDGDYVYWCDLPQKATWTEWASNHWALKDSFSTYVVIQLRGNNTIDVDDFLARRCHVAVAPESFGRIKALYR